MTGRRVGPFVVTRAQTAVLGETLGRLAPPNLVVALSGPLGAGKTTFARAVAAGAGCDPAAVSSPTFVLVHEYHGRVPVAHCDAYRLRHPEDFGKLGLEGDTIVDSTVHGGLDQAIYIYSSEDYQWWSQQLGKPIAPGTFGENLTISGFNIDEFVVGDQLTLNNVVLEISAPRTPCFKLAAAMNDPTFGKQFAKAARPGAYARVLREGAPRRRMSRRQRRPYSLNDHQHREDSNREEPPEWGRRTHHQHPSTGDTQPRRQRRR